MIHIWQKRGRTLVTYYRRWKPEMIVQPHNKQNDGEWNQLQFQARNTFGAGYPSIHTMDSPTSVLLYNNSLEWLTGQEPQVSPLTRRDETSAGSIPDIDGDKTQKLVSVSEADCGPRLAMRRNPRDSLESWAIVTMRFCGETLCKMVLCPPPCIMCSSLVHFIHSRLGCSDYYPHGVSKGPHAQWMCVYACVQWWFVVGADSQPRGSEFLDTPMSAVYLP